MNIAVAFNIDGPSGIRMGDLSGYNGDAIVIYYDITEKNTGSSRFFGDLSKNGGRKTGVIGSMSASASL